MSSKADLDRELEQLQQRLPPFLARALGWVRRPSSAWARYPLALALVLGGFLGFLPILGLWMSPLGLALIAQDVPFLRRLLARLLARINARMVDSTAAIRQRADKCR
jgi:hypothetical protein